MLLNVPLPSLCSHESLCFKILLTRIDGLGFDIPNSITGWLARLLDISQAVLDLYIDIEEKP